MNSFARIAIVVYGSLFAAIVQAQTNIFDHLETSEEVPFKVIGTGFVTDASHPWHPDDFKKYEIVLTLEFDPEMGECSIDFASGNKEKPDHDYYYVRRGRLFQVDEKGAEKTPESFGDLSPVTIAALHAEIVANAILERRQNIQLINDDNYLFAWHDELWDVNIENNSGQIISLKRRTFSDVHGDGLEEIVYDEHSTDNNIHHSKFVTVTQSGREIAKFEFGSIQRGIEFSIPAGDRKKDHTRLIASSDINFKQIAPKIYSIDLDSINTRVMVAEFIDFLVVIEGAYNSRNGDLLAKRITNRFHKRVKYFAFSHLHGQYVGSTRSWIANDATIIVPPSTVKLIEEMTKAPHDLQPDSLSRNPKPLLITTAKEGRRIDDVSNALEIYNVESEHTDEYFIFYFPRQKLLLTGDLLFYRPGQPLTGRSKKLCETVQKLRLDVDTYVCTWPLAGYDTKNIVTKAEMQNACIMGN